MQKRNKKDFLVLAIFNCSRHGSRGVAAILRRERTQEEPSRRFLRFFRPMIGCFAPQMASAALGFTNLVSLCSHTITHSDYDGNVLVLAAHRTKTFSGKSKPSRGSHEIGALRGSLTGGTVRGPNDINQLSFTIWLIANQLLTAIPTRRG